MTKHDKFNKILSRLNDNGGLIFEEEEHRYVYDNQVCLSVTRLISLYTSQKSFKKISSRINMRAYAKWGSAIHKCIETYLLTGKLDSIPKEFQPHVIEAAGLLMKQGVSEYATELQVVFPSFLLAGTIDIFGISKTGRLFILDWKTASVATFKHQLQIYIYRKIVEECWRREFGENVDIDVYIACIPRKLPHSKKLYKYSDKIPKEAEAIWTLHRYNYNEEGVYWNE